MVQVFCSPMLAEVGLRKGLLEDHGIACFVRNEQTAMASGRIPFTDTWPELWVLNDADAARAKEILDQGVGIEDRASTGSWRCPGCGEEIEGQFSVCWNCSQERPVQPSA